MKSKKQLFEEAPVLNAVLSLALPSIMGQVILVIYNIADTLFVSFSASRYPAPARTARIRKAAISHSKRRMEKPTVLL